MEYFRIKKSDSPIIASAIHCGHFVRDEVRDKFYVTEETRYQEEDPFTDKFIEFAPTQIIVNASRFEFDINRPPDKAVYINPEDAWEIKIWNNHPSKDIIETSRNHYKKFYSEIKILFDQYVKRFGKLFVYDVHSYNYRIRSDSNDNDPDFNIGTGNIDNEYWSGLITGFINDLSAFDFDGRQPDVRKNVKFKGGFFSKWINENFRNNICVLSVEVKKTFMNELTGEVYPDKVEQTKNALRATMPGVIRNLMITKSL